MWNWFTANCVWIFFFSAALAAILYFTRQRSWARKIEVTKDRLPPGTYKPLDVAYLVALGILLLIMVLALVAFVQGSEGISNIVTSETIQTWLLTHGIRLIIILVIATWLWFALARFLPPLISRAMVRPVKGESKQGMGKRAKTLSSVFVGVGKGIIAVMAFLMVLSEFNVNIAPILAGFGIAGIAVGFGAQYLIRDLIAGIFLLLENQYRVGDVVKIANTSGLVEEVTLRKTVLRDLDGIVHHVPNGEISIASNFTRHYSRVNLNISVSYGTDLERAMNVINRVGKELAADENWKEKIITPPQALRVDNLGDSGIDIKILGDVKPIEQWAVMGELRLRLKKAFDAEGIEIPWPHTKVYFGNSPQNP